MKNLIKNLVAFICFIGKARWIVSSENDPGFRIFGCNIYYYKWSDTFLYIPKKELHYRLATKREIIIKK